MRYRDKTGRRRLESTSTTDWDEAQRQMRERLQSRDDNILDVVRKGKQTTFDEWADFFLENYSKPPIGARKTHEANQAAMKNLDSHVWSNQAGRASSHAIEVYLRQRLGQRVRRKPGRGRREGF